MRRNGVVVDVHGQRKQFERKAFLVQFEDDLSFMAYMRGDNFAREHLFYPMRRFRFDYAFLKRKVAVEVQGFFGGGHHGAPGLYADCEKLSLAATLGWRVVLTTHKQIRSGEGIRWVADALDCLQ